MTEPTSRLPRASQEGVEDEPADLENGRSTTPSVSNEAELDAHPRVSEARWDALNKFTRATAMGVFSVGNALKNNTIGASALALLAVHSAEKSLGDLQYKGRESSVVHAVNAAGFALWSSGIGADNSILKGVGPALICATNAVSAGVHYHRNMDWHRDTLALAEMAAFSVAGFANSTVAGSLALGNMALGFLSDAATQDKGYLGLAIGGFMWAVGEGMENAPLKGLGAGVIAAAEAGRLIYPAYKDHVHIHSCEAAPQQPSNSPAPLAHVSASSVELTPGVHLANPAPGEPGCSTDGMANTDTLRNPFAPAASHYAPPACSLPHSEHGDVGSMPFSPGGSHVWTPETTKTRRHSA